MCYVKSDSKLRCFVKKVHNRVLDFYMMLRGLGWSRNWEWKAGINHLSNVLVTTQKIVETKSQQWTTENYLCWSSIGKSSDRHQSLQLLWYCYCTSIVKLGKLHAGSSTHVANIVAISPQHDVARTQRESTSPRQPTNLLDLVQLPTLRHWYV